MSIEGGQIEPAPVEPLARVLLAGVTAAAEYVATAQDPVAARVDAGRTVELILDRLRRRSVAERGVLGRLGEERQSTA